MSGGPAVAGGPVAVGGRPIRDVVIKLHERCNIACDHCYMYEASDQGWRARPSVMADDTVRQTALRLAEHAHDHALAQVRVVLHGGEPLLAGALRVGGTLETFRRAVAPPTTVLFTMQTNGILLDDALLDLLRDYGVRIGVSIDGGRAANDRHRRYASGRSSYDETVRAIDLLGQPRNRSAYGGLLCTVDLSNDPVDTYERLLAHRPPMIDLLLPHGNWDYPPPGLRERGGATPYADWLIRIFDRWYDAPRRETGIRLFESIISLLLGGASDTEAIGPGIPAAVTVESDGSIEGSDGLKTAGPVGGATGMNVFTHSFDEVVRHPLISAARLGIDGLGGQCRRCPVVSVCGGGLYAHRFSAEDGFSRPSVYCDDLYRLIGHIRKRVEGDLAPP